MCRICTLSMCRICTAYNYQGYRTSRARRKIKEEGAMVIIEHYDLAGSLAVRKLSNGMAV